MYALFVYLSHNNLIWLYLADIFKIVEISWNEKQCELKCYGSDQLSLFLLFYMLITFFYNW
jgi:hypothetical protein